MSNLKRWEEEEEEKGAKLRKGGKGGMNETIEVRSKNRL